MDLALEEFDHALDASADLPKAFEAIDKMLTDAGDWTGLARAYRRMLKRVGHDAPGEKLLSLWGRLGEICLDELGDTESAIAALEVSSSIDPTDMNRHEQLADLYLEAGDSRRQDAIAELLLCSGRTVEITWSGTS